jgi:hypothetical protein
MGLLGVCLLIQQSLTPSPAVEIELPGGDKLLHFSAYCTLMLWFGFIYLPGKAHLVIGAGLILMGVTLEILQRATGCRSFDYSDLICNWVGIMAGWLFARTRLSMTLIQFERVLALKK